MLTKSRLFRRKADRGSGLAEQARTPLSADEAQTVRPAVDTAANVEYSEAELKRLLRDSVALEKLLRDSMAVRAGATPTAPRPAESRPSAGRRRRVLLAAGAAAVATGLIVNTVALVHLSLRSPKHAHVAAAPGTSGAPGTPGTSGTSAAVEINAAAAWAGRELSHDAQIVADPGMTAALTARGFAHIQTVSAGSAGTSRTVALTFDYVASTAALRADAASGNAVERALNSSLPVAAFGSGARQVILQQVSSDATAEIASRRSDDERNRRTAEQQLLANSAIHVSGAARTALQGGALDLRAATVLALMANTSHVDLLSVNVDGPEQAAGLPARSIDVRTDAASAVQAMLSNLPPSYAPSADTRLPNGTDRIVWPLDPEPPTVLN
jgi:hypothetical protein